MNEQAFEELCAKAWSVGCRNGCFNHISPWTEKRWKEGDWEHHMPALRADIKEQFRAVVREVLKGAA